MNKIKEFYSYNKRKIIAAIVVVLVLYVLLFGTKLICFHNWGEATCSTLSTCSKCGRTRGELKPHEFAPATCTEPERCKKCHKTKGEKLGHKANKPTCTKASICERCGKKVERSLGHDIKNWKTTKQPTCTEDGIREGKCKRCGKTITKRAAALGHSWSKWKTIKKATLEHGGKKERSCSICGKTEDKKTAALDPEEVEEKLEENFPKYDALSYFERYGNEEYPFGFKVHSIMGVIAERPIDTKTWFLKYEVTITNMFGADYDTVAEAKIKKVSGGAKITYWYVYN